MTIFSTIKSNTLSFKANNLLTGYTSGTGVVSAADSVLTAIQKLNGNIAAAGGSVTVSDDTTTNATYYPTFATAISGTITAVKTSSTKLTYTPTTGTLFATIFSSSSDATLKTNINNITNGLSTINRLSPKSFQWIENGLTGFGVIAQDLEVIVPQLVTTNELTDLKSVNYDGIIAFLISAVQELSTELKTFKGA